MILNYRTLLSCILCVFIVFESNAQINLFTESFDELDGSTMGASAEGVNWNAICPSCVTGDYYEVTNGAFENGDSNGPATWTTDPMDISSCSRITVDIDYSGSPFGTELESSSDCAGCAGDPSNALQLECQTCWDFMQFNINIDGVFTQMELIGTTNIATTFEVDWEDENCPNLGDMAFLQIVSQTWGAAEMMRFDNVAMVCHDDGGITATLDGGETLCGTECGTVNWEITGGVPMYDIEYLVSSGPFQYFFGLLGEASVGSVNVCLDNSIAVPFYDSGTNTIFLNDMFGTDFIIEIIGVTDMNGCNIDVMGQEANFILNSGPTINVIPDIMECTDPLGGLTLNLSQYEIAIGGGNTVNWYSDEDLMNPIGPSFTTLVNTTIYAQVVDGSSCMSSSIEVEIELILTPIIFDVMDVESCESYTLPPIAGTNFTGNQSYYSGPGGTGVTYNDGDVIDVNTTIFIYDSNDGCADEKSFMITILPVPDLLPISNVTSCGYFVLPEILGNDLSGNEAYFDQPDGGGLSYLEGDTIFSNTAMFAYDVLGICPNETFFVITITPGPVFDMPTNLSSCGSVILPVIVGDDLSGNEAYFTEMGGAGTMFMPGDVISNSLILYIFDESGTCEGEVIINIEVTAGPVIDMPLIISNCGSVVLPEINGNDLSGNEGYYSGTGGTGTMYMPGDIILNSLVLFIYDESGSCEAEVMINVEISAEPVIDMPFILSSCGSVILPVIIGTDLSGSEAYFTGMDGTGTMFLPGDAITSSILLYIYDQSGSCETEVSININVSAGPVLDNVIDVTTCDYYVLPAIFGQNLFDPIYADNNTVQYMEGDTIFETIELTISDQDPNNPDCFVLQTFTITLLDSPNAGIDQLLSICGGSIINVSTLLENGIDDSGEFQDPNSTGALNGDMLNLNVILVDSIILEYILITPCGADTSNYQINIVNIAFAGTDQSNDVCEGNLVELTDLVVDGDVGGEFVFVQNGEIITQVLTDSIVNYGNSVDILYIVGDGVNCPRDSATLTMSLIDLPTFDVQDTVVCGNFVLTDIEGTNLDGTELYFTEANGQGISLISGDTIFDSIVLYCYIDNGTCVAQDSFEVSISESSTFFINETICNDDTLFVNGIAYNIFNQSGSQPFTNQFGCDSNLVINVSFFEPDTNFINIETCFGASIVVNNVTYDESNPSGQQVYPFADINGCDSVIVVSLTFSDANVTPINEMICENDSIEINGIFYSIDNPTGMDTLMAQGGCDSILDISLTFMNESTSDVDTMICIGESIEVNGNTYDINNQVGTEIVAGGNTEGCDSIVSVQISFFIVPEGELFGTFCGNEVIDTLGEQFDINNQEQTVILPGASVNGCDSSVFVSFDFIEVEEGLIEETICFGATISIEGTTYSQLLGLTGGFISPTANGCDSLTNVIVSVEEIPFDFEFGVVGCDAETGYLLISNLPTDEDMFLIGDFNDFPGGASLIGIGDTLFNIPVGITNAYVLQTLEDCQGSMLFEIEAPAPFVVDLDPIAEITEGQGFTANLDVPDNSSILWTPATNISCTDCANPTFNPSVDTEYIVEVTTPDGCMISDTILIRVEQTLDIFVPNIFSPNNDGINDVFYMFSEASGFYDLFIYDRWGNRMFEGIELETNNLNDGWDGNFNGQSVKPGVYVYYLVFTQTPINPDDPIAEPLLLKGDITVVK